jgi:hypothetical protein
MIKLGNRRRLADVRLVEVTSESTIDFDSATPVEYDSENRYDFEGSFDIIRGQLLFLFSKNNQIFLGFNNIYYPINQTKIIYNLVGKDRYFMIELPTGQRMELNYKLKDLIEDPILLLGSHEENEDYDFGCWLYNMRYSDERQQIVLENQRDRKKNSNSQS